LLTAPIGLALVTALVWFTPPAKLLSTAAFAVLVVAGWLQVVYKIEMAALLGLGELRWWNLARVASSGTYLAAVLLVAYSGRTDVSAFAMMLGLSWCAAFIVASAPLLPFATAALPTKLAGSPMATRSEIVRFALGAQTANMTAAANYKLDQAVLYLLVSAGDLGQYAVAVTVTFAPVVLVQAQTHVAYGDVSRRVARVWTDRGDSAGRLRRSRWRGSETRPDIVRG
jgi:hypothetical protein